MIAFDSRTAVPQEQANAKQTSELVRRLCSALKRESIDYCHWKSNAALERSACGENDLDLLISRPDAQRFAEILHRLDFKEALVPKENELPGIRDYYGYDPQSRQLIHVHAHFQLTLGNDLSKNYRLPLEKPYLESAVQGDLFCTPSLEFELLVFVLRMVLKHSTWDAILMQHGHLSKSEARELEYLATPETIVRAHSLLQHIPGLGADLFEDCLQVLQRGCSIWRKIRVGEQLQRVLHASARYPHSYDLILKLTRRIWWPALGRVFKYNPKNRCANGGLFIAIVGGDGAGKTTVIDELSAWLSRKFGVLNVHMGKPDWSWTTIILRGILKIGTLLQLYPFEGDVYEESGQPHGLPWFIRTVCTARDRYLTYVRARRFSSNGGLALCDRFSLPGFLSMDGAQCAQAVASLKTPGRLGYFLAKLEKSYYDRISLPDLLIVLKVNPDVAVGRKTEESEVSVRARSSEVWEADWSAVSGHTVDAGQSKEEVLAQIKSLVWSYL
jgi:thymidylate kinase